MALATSHGCEIDCVQLVSPYEQSAAGAKLPLDKDVTALADGGTEPTNRCQVRAVLEGASAPPLPGKYELRYCFQNNKYQVGHWGRWNSVSGAQAT